MFCRYRATKNEKERLRQWVPNKIAEAPDTGHAFAVCLLTDIRGSRALSSRLSAEEYNALMEDYYKRISPPVNRHGGRIWDFSGDGMMCLFAARHEDRDMEQRACMAALEILEAVDLFNRQLNRNIQLNTGIAIHSGWLELGGKTLGDVGNTVSSIEGLNKRLHTNALASHTVVEGFRKSGGTISARQRMGEESGSLLLRRLGAFSLPGKSIPLSIYELMRFHKNDTEKTIRLCELYDAALSVFEEHRRMEAAKQLEEILAAFPDDMPSQCLLFTCREYSRKAPQQGEPAVMLFGEFPDNQRYSNSIDTPGSI
jgi:adenylate cyclase